MEDVEVGITLGGGYVKHRGTGIHADGHDVVFDLFAVSELHRLTNPRHQHRRNERDAVLVQHRRFTRHHRRLGVNRTERHHKWTASPIYRKGPAHGWGPHGVSRPIGIRVRSATGEPHAYKRKHDARRNSATGIKSDFGKSGTGATTQDRN